MTTKAEEIAMVDRERAELEDIYYRLDNFQPNDDIEEIMPLVLQAIEARKKYLLNAQEIGMIQGTIESGVLKITPEDRRN